MKNRKFKKLLITTMVLSTAVLTLSLALAQGGPPGGGQRKGPPPPEAFTVCEDKASGDSCTVTTPQGEETGTCEMPRGDKLVCAPERNKERGNREE